MIFILDPGPGLDVATFISKDAALRVHAFETAHARLFSVDRGRWRRFDGSTKKWAPVSMRDQLSVKVLEAGAGH